MQGMPGTSDAGVVHGAPDCSGGGRKPGREFRQTRKIATIGSTQGSSGEIPAQSAGGDQ